jgi:hypothetical protein
MRQMDRTGRLVGLSRGATDITLDWRGELYAGRTHAVGGNPAPLTEAVGRVIAAIPGADPALATRLAGELAPRATQR